MAKFIKSGKVGMYKIHTFAEFLGEIVLEII